jgi:hypothetical protein
MTQPRLPRTGQARGRYLPVRTRPGCTASSAAAANTTVSSPAPGTPTIATERLPLLAFIGDGEVHVDEQRDVVVGSLPPPGFSSSSVGLADFEYVVHPEIHNEQLGGRDHATSHRVNGGPPKMRREGCCGSPSARTETSSDLGPQPRVSIQMIIGVGAGLPYKRAQGLAAGASVVRRSEATHRWHRRADALFPTLVEAWNEVAPLRPCHRHR